MSKHSEKAADEIRITIVPYKPLVDEENSRAFGD
jgi:hypothetical protein